MHEIASDKDKLLALQRLIRAAQVKSQEITSRDDPRSAELIADLLALIDDAAIKLLTVRWIDQPSVWRGVMTYERVIDQI